MSYKSSFTDKATPVAVGVGAYFGLVWVFLCYPAFIIGITISRMMYGVVIDTGISSMSDEYFAAISVTLGVMIVVSILIFILSKYRQWSILLLLYLITLLPFLKMICHFCHSGGVGEPPIFPYPLNWFFLF